MIDIYCAKIDMADEELNYYEKLLAKYEQNPYTARYEIAEIKEIICDLENYIDSLWAIIGSEYEFDIDYGFIKNM